MKRMHERATWRGRGRKPICMLQVMYCAFYDGGRGGGGGGGGVASTMSMSLIPLQQSKSFITTKNPIIHPSYQTQ